MNRKKLGIFISIIILLILTALVIKNSNEKSLGNSFTSEKAALNAGIYKIMKIYNFSDENKKFAETIFSYKEKNNSYFVNKLIINGTGDLKISENLVVIKIINKGEEYFFEQATPLFSIKQIDEKGEVSHPVWTIPIEKQLTFIVGKTEKQNDLIYAEDEKVNINKDGTFVYVYEGSGEPPELIFE